VDLLKNYQAYKNSPGLKARAVAIQLLNFGFPAD
jgi:hypothetical protein